MKKIFHLKFLLLLSITLVACNTNGNVEQGTQPIVKERPELKVKDVKDVDVVNTHGGIEGLERMQGFYENLQKGVASDLRIVHYTIEGAPIVTDLTFDGESLEVEHDSTRDTYGSGEISTNSCSTMIREANPTNISYIAIDCKGIPYAMDQILKVSYDLSQQDFFEFELKYGVKLENEINTLKNTSKKEINTNETQVIADFEMPESVMQEVYKRLVLANYLGEKELMASCKSEDAMNYYMKVYINGGDQEYRWTSCDQSWDAVKLTEIVQFIIEQSEINQSENPVATVQGYVLEIKDDRLLIGEELNRLEYEWIKEDLKQTNLDSYVFDFTFLEGVHTEAFKLGDKVHATIDGSVKGSKPGAANVKEIKKME